MKIILTPNKLGLYGKLLERLKEAEHSVKGASKKSYIPFPVIFEAICCRYSIKKESAWECLFLLREFGFIEIIKFKGIRLNYQIKND